MSKDEALKELKERLLWDFGEKIVGLYLYGSLAKGEARPESDIDVLVVYDDIDRSKLLDGLSAIAFEVACKYGELVQPVLMSREEFMRQIGQSPFLWEVLKHGRAMIAVKGLTEWKLVFEDYVKLAGEYLGYAEGALKEGKIRLAIDAGYNVIELTIKALIISKGAKLATSHGGIIQQFGELFVKTGRISGELGKEIHKALILRAQARYIPTVTLGMEEGEKVVSLAKKILEICRRELKA